MHEVVRRHYGTVYRTGISRVAWALELFDLWQADSREPLRLSEGQEVLDHIHQSSF